MQQTLDLNNFELNTPSPCALLMCICNEIHKCVMIINSENCIVLHLARQDPLTLNEKDY